MPARANKDHNPSAPKGIYLLGRDVLLRPQVTFEWNLLYACNYRCPHCIFDGKWEEYGKRTVYLPAASWMKHWTRIHKKYGRVSLVVSGGEPFEYPHFITLMEKLSQIHYPISISTNASGDWKRFTRRIRPERVILNLSFQPGFNKIDEILKKISLLKANGFKNTTIHLCAYPPYLTRLDEYVRKANAANETLHLSPFYGTYNNANYPDAYTPKERAQLGIDTVWEKNVKRKGSLCGAGYRAALVFPDGKVARCGQIGERSLLGSIFSEDFTLLPQPLPCSAEICPCMEAVPVDPS